MKDVHIHFHVMVEGKNGFLTPVIFSPDVVRQFGQFIGAAKGRVKGRVLLVITLRRIGSVRACTKAGKVQDD